MKELIITKLQSLTDAEICDRLFRDYMRWFILQRFAFMKSAVKMYKSYGFEELEAFKGFEGATHNTGAVEIFMIKQNY